MKKTMLLLVFLFGLGWTISAQSVLDTRLDIQFENVSIIEALNQLIDESDISLSFSDNLIPDRQLNHSFKNQPLRFILDQLLINSMLAYRERASVIILFQKKNEVPPNFTISGYLEDAESGERLVGASIFDQLSGIGTASNDYGYFSLQLPAGRVDLRFSYLGYKVRSMPFTLKSDLEIPVVLDASLTLAEVLVLGSDSIKTLSRSGMLLDPTALQEIPRLAGEADLLRMAYLMPGVQTGTDGVEGMHVRGGNAGHNLVLLDGVPVYYATHAAGVFSIFNADAIRSANLIKGGFSAKYGGRLSSVLDVRTKEGNSKKFVGSAEAGLISGRLSMEGPLIKDKSSFFFAGRWSYLNWYIVPLSKRNRNASGQKGGLSYQFSDVNAKLNYSLGTKDKLYLSFYRGQDDFENGGQSVDTLSFFDRVGVLQSYKVYKGNYENLNWSNQIGVLRWNHQFNDRLFANTSATFSELLVQSQYQTLDSIISINTGQFVSPFLAVDFNSSIRDVGIRTDFDFYLNPRHRVSFGGSANFRRFNPRALVLDDEFEDAIITRKPRDVHISSQEYTVFADDRFNLSQNWQLYGGVRFSFNAVNGKGYLSTEPRLGIYGNLSPKIGFKASLDRMSQFIHQLSNSNLGLPTDLWVPSTDIIKPETAWQTSVGFDFNLHKNWTVSIEGYDKKMFNLVNFSEGANFLSDWRNNLDVGSGNSQGIEVLIRRKLAKLTGWVAYTWSFTDREFNRTNSGEKYPFKLDRRHDVKLVLSYKFNDHFDISSSWVLSSGFAFSRPDGQYILNVPGDFSPPQDLIVPNFGKKNDDQMPAYHRLDLGGNFRFGTKKLKHRLHFGIYNVYDKRNLLYISYRTKYVASSFDIRQRLDFVQVSLLPFLPSLSYAIQFE